MSLLIRTIMLVVVISICHARDSNSSSASVFPPGSPQRCLTEKGQRIPIFEVLAGGGWDNLRNRDMNMIMDLKYSRCRTTDDGRFLIPDNLYTIPIKSSMVDTYAELFEHWNNYTSTTSSSINIHAGLELPHVGISGKFSDGYEKVKSHQFFDKSVTTRVQVRYARYVAKLASGSSLSAEFRRRLRKIGAHLRLNRTDSARYESQLLVRDFGTHVVSSIDVGATMSQVDSVYSSFYKKFESDKHELLASASASFFKIFDFGIDYSKTTTTTMTDQYFKNRARSKVETFGGPLFRPKNYTGNDWSRAVEDDMVAIDKSGDPIYFIITDDTLPDMPRSTVMRVREFVRQAVELYYKHNMHHGCTRRESPNFSFQANVDDGTCQPTKTNYSFGGVYQSCSGGGFTDLCAKMRQKNPLTGDYSCPSGFEAVKIQDGSKSASTSQRRCHRCWLFATCCHDQTLTASAQYTAYWCSATGPVPKDTGFLFGGLYTNAVGNRVTGTSGCPAEFYGLHILDNLVVCVSDDYELGTPNSLPFAGFFSCKSGNPLALKENAGLLKSGKVSKLKTFMMESGASQYPKGCPDGYSQHLAVNDRGCEVNYCVKAGALTSQGLPKVNLPPFMKMPNDEPQSMTDIVFTDDGTLWTTMDDAKTTMPEYLESHGLPQPMEDDKSADSKGSRSGDESGDGSSGDGSSSSGGLSGGGFAAISIFATLACVAIVAVVVKVVKRKKAAGLYQQDF